MRRASLYAAHDPAHLHLPFGAIEGVKTIADLKLAA